MKALHYQNSHYADGYEAITFQRAKSLTNKNIRYIGNGIKRFGRIDGELLFPDLYYRPSQQ